MRKPKPLADFIDACLGPALAAQGFASSDVIVAWPDIVGERLAAFTQPIKIEWKRRPSCADPDARPEPATLVVRVESAFALEMQHVAPLVMERINAHYGWRCIGRVVLKQGPVEQREPELPAKMPLSADETERLRAAIAPVGEEGLRGALQRLGEGVIGAKSTGSRTKA